MSRDPDKIILNENLELTNEEWCRFCVEKTEEYSSVFQDDLHETLKNCLGITIQKTDNWPKMICTECLKTAKLCISFVSKIWQNESKLRTLYGDLEAIEWKPDFEIINVPSISVRGETENDPLLDIEKTPVIEEKPLRRRGRPRKTPQSPMRKPENEEIPKSPKRKRHNKETSEENQRKIEEFFKMDCNICEKSFVKLRDLEIHYRKIHNRKGYVVCCNVKFNRPSKILEHLDLHMNPEAFKCDECGKSFKNKEGLRFHKSNSHTPAELHKYKCTVCGKTFMSLKRFKKHKYVHISEEEKSHICPHCSKAFAYESNLSSHIRHMHDKTIYHVCEICAKMFKSKHVFVQHQKTHNEEITPKLPCSICGKAFKYQEQLRRHMKRHNEAGEVFRCHFCNKESPNSLALYKHIKCVHLKEKKHKCSLCSAAFKTVAVLREHLITHSASPTNQTDVGSSISGSVSSEFIKA
ncbi:hypothetical protein DMENIID0001_099870 [Sergentomyia squamirostris]